MSRVPMCWFRCCVTILTALAVAACVGGSRLAERSTPPDPPPIPARKPAPPDGWHTRTARVAVTPTVRSAPRHAAGAIRRAARAPTHLASYRVRPGDTVFGVARRLGVPLRGVLDANALRPPYVLRVGQVLRIPNPRKHIVAQGDTVYGVSRRYRVDLTALVHLNRIEAPFTLRPGDDLILPVWTRSATPVVRVASTGRAAPRAARSMQPVGRAGRVEPPGPSRLAAIPKSPPRAGGKFLWPAEGPLIASYGPKTGGSYNDGINIAAPRGAAVRAAENGVVVYRGNELRGFGNLILLRHAGGWVTAYAHTDAFLVRRGDTVKRGQVIARVGSSGNVTRPQLHFEIRKGTRAVDPTRLLGPQRAAVAVN